jgi:hypothetical protein
MRRLSDIRGALSIRAIAEYLDQWDISSHFFSNIKWYAALTLNKMGGPQDRHRKAVRALLLLLLFFLAK